MSIEIIDLISKDDIAIHLPSREAVQKNALLIFNHLAGPTMDDSQDCAELFSLRSTTDHLRLWKNQQVVFYLHNVET
jgi:hypothetical protein